MGTAFSLIFGTNSGPGHRVRPLLLKKNGVCFNKFRLYNTHILRFLSTNNVYNMYFIHYSYDKKYGICQGASKQTPDLRISQRPPVLKFLDPQLVTDNTSCYNI